MKTFFLLFGLLLGLCQVKANDSLVAVVVQTINEERRFLGVDTLEYEEDVFCFASSWADSTNRFFNDEGMEFSRKAAHRNFKSRVQEYERVKGREWLYMGECIVTGKFKHKDVADAVKYYAETLLESEDHHKILVDPEYRGVMVGITIKEDKMSIVVFSTREHENKKGGK